MKSNLAKLSLALLSTTFLLGCQDQGSGPAGPDVAPQFNKPTNGVHDHGDDSGSGGKNTGSPFYEYTFSGDITTDPTPAGASSSSGGVWLHQCCGEAGDGLDDETLSLSDALLGNFGSPDQLAECFGGIFPLIEYIADLRSDRGTVSGVHAVFHFVARDITGAIEANYILRLIGTVTATDDDDGIFPPEVGETTTVTFTHGFTGGGKKTKRKELCIGELETVDSSIELTGSDTDLDLEP